MRNRVLALLAAVALIVGAVVLRGVLDDDDDGTEVVGGPDSTSAPQVTGEIVCITELEVACAGIEGSIVEAAGDTMARLSADGAEAPAAWITFAPLPQAVDASRTAARLAPLFTGGERLATTPLVLVARFDRGDVLEAACGEVTWRCVGDNAGATWESLGGDARWGEPKVGHEAPDATARGAVVFAWLAASYFGGSAGNLDDDGFRTWLGQLERAVPDTAFGGRSPLEQMVGLLGSFDVVGTTAVEADDLVTKAGRSAQFTIYPSDVANAEVVVATTGGELPGGVVDTVREALAASGWQAAEGESTGSVAGLPDAGQVERLRTRIWEEVG